MFWEEKKRHKLTPDNRPIKTRKKSKSRIIINILIVVLVCVFLYSGYRVYEIASVYYRNQKLQSEIQSIFHEQDIQLEQVVGDMDSSEDRESSEIEMENPLEAIQALNEDVAAWIQIDDTVIDYPVVQGDDNDYYLNHDIYGGYTACGSIFMDYRNRMQLPMENIILYGHRMNDDSMFGELIKFTKEDFYKDHPSFLLITENEFLQCDIFAVYITTTDFEYYRTAFADENDFMEYIEACRNQSMYDSDIELTPQSRIVTLSTCDSTLDVSKGRLVIQAKITPLTSVE